MKDTAPPRLMSANDEVVQVSKVTVHADTGAWDDVLLELWDGTYALGKAWDVWAVTT